jgi:hypothetical protein
MKSVFNVILLLLLGVILLLGGQGCFHSTDFEIVDGHFYTFNREKAQEEIPFPIIMPGYIPTDKLGYSPKPLISGPLKKHQTGDGVEVRILFQVFYVGNMVIPYEIHEYNYPVLPPAPEDSPDLMYYEVSGVSVVSHEIQGQSTDYYFNYKSIYFVVNSYEITSEEVYKMIESMIAQFE